MTRPGTAERPRAARDLRPGRSGKPARPQWVPLRPEDRDALVQLVERTERLTDFVRAAILDPAGRSRGPAVLRR